MQNNNSWNRASEELNRDLKKELNFAMNDIRQKVVEQGWFGKQVTPDHSTHGFYHTDDLSPSKEQSQSRGNPTPSQPLQPSKFDEVYGRDYQPIEPAQEHDDFDHSQRQDRGGIDR